MPDLMSKIRHLDGGIQGSMAGALPGTVDTGDHMGQFRADEDFVDEGGAIVSGSRSASPKIEGKFLDLHPSRLAPKVQVSQLVVTVIVISGHKSRATAVDKLLGEVGKQVVGPLFGLRPSW